MPDGRLTSADSIPSTSTSWSRRATWPDEAELPLVDGAVAAAFAETGALAGRHRELSIVFSDDAHIRALNAELARQGQADQRAVFPGFSACTGGRCRRCWAISCWPPKRSRARRELKASRSSTISPISSSTACCIFSATITRRMRRPRRWRPSSARTREACHSRSLRVTEMTETDRTTMNDKPETAAKPTPAAPSGLRKDGRRTGSEYRAGAAHDLADGLPSSSGCRPVQAAQRLQPARGNRRRARRKRQRCRVLLARRTGDAQQHPAAARGARRGRHGAARRHRGGRDRHARSAI